MHGAAAVTAHRNANSKKHERVGGSSEIVASSSELKNMESGIKESDDKNKDEDQEYNEEEDHLYLFPPPSYRKGDISLGVLMSG